MLKYAHMHTIIIIALVLAALIALFLIMGAVLPKQYTVSVSTIINKPITEVFDYIKTIKNQEEYSVWVMEDPGIALTYTGTDGTIGFTAAWDSKIGNVGAGSQTIANIIENSRIDMDLHFIRPFAGDQKAATIVEAVSDTATKVTAEFYSKDKFPMNVMSYMIGSKIIKKAQLQNLANIKANLEK